MKTNSGRYYALPKGRERSALVKRGHTVIAEVFTDREPGDQYQTATLYAAAPALLAALQGLADAVERFTNTPEDWPELAAARAALSQAQQGHNV